MSYSNLNCKAKVADGPLALRASDEDNATVLKWIPQGTIIAVDSGFVAVEHWLRAVYNNTLGYVKHAYLTVYENQTYYGVAGCVRYGTALLKTGSTGSNVRQLQVDLFNMGWNNLSMDGDFGPATKTAVQAFQGQCGLTQDGVVGTDTKAFLYSSVIIG